MTIEQAEKLKKFQLELMDEIDRLCRENHIRYYIVGGTLIGAIRHKGFIPWDIDMDIAMPRKDYDYFKSVCFDQLDKKYQYCDFTIVDNYDKPHAIVCIKNTKLISKMDKLYSERKNLGIFIDIFPLDNVPDDEKEQKKQIKRISHLKKLRYLRIPYYTSPSRVKRTGRKIIQVLLGWMSIYKLNKATDNCMRRYNNIKCSMMCNMAGRYSYEKESLDNEVFGKPVLVEFEGRQYFAPNQYDRYLKHIYGNYMKLPPMEEQTEYLNVYDSIDFGLNDIE